MTKESASADPANGPSKRARDPSYRLALCTLASGSKGNALYVSNGSTAILVDAGLSGKEIQRRLASRGLSAGDLSAIIVSHEHADHIHGVGVLARRFSLPVYISERTKQAAPHLGKIRDLVPFECGKSFEVDRLTIHPFSVSHDAEDPVGFTVRQDGIKIGIATDLGIATSMVKEHLKESSLLVIEANHDPVMLEEGPYPWPLKQRISGRTGHLSNEASRGLLEEVYHDRLQHVILAHISEINNTPERALSVVRKSLNGAVRLSTASQDVCSDIVYIERYRASVNDFGPAQSGTRGRNASKS